MTTAHEGTRRETCSAPPRPVPRVIPLLILLVSVTGLPAQQLPYDVEYPTVRYSTSAPTDRISELDSAMERGEIELSFDAKSGYLASVLGQLGISRASQMLVFSKTSFQEHFVSPETPRAIYFTDDVYVAWLRGGDLLEIATLDPNLGPVFYTLEQQRADMPRFQRRMGLCLACHDTYGLTGGGVPRFLIGSGPTTALGGSAAHEGWQLTTDRTPIRERWGGWYVTGTHGTQEHMGNVIIRDPAEVTARDLTSRGNLTDLGDLLDTRPYLGEHSDIVALMVAEHQMSVQNLITRAGWEARGALDADPASPRVEELAEPVVRAMLFVDEAALSGPISGTSGFRSHFENRGPWDERGRSLRQLDLNKRLFRYPLSYVIYSAAFDALPLPVKERVYRRVWEVLADEDRSEAFDHLSDTDRAATLGILRATKADFARWMATNGVG